MSNTLPLWARRINDWANRHEVILLFWTLVLFLRLPNLAEPYWYGDEAIYLTIGVALKNGAVLYRDIVDHKTPLIYFLAMVPNQLWFRVLLIVWSLASTSFFFMLAKRWLKQWAALLATLLFVLFTCLPWLEGNIPNGELFVIGFMLAGMWLAAKSGFWIPLEMPTKRKASWQPHQLVGVLVAGMLLSLGMLTKVPAVLDIGAIGAGLFFAWNTFKSSSIGARVRWILLGGTTLTVGVAIPFAISILYFWSRGALPAYLDFGLLYNFHYTSNWSLPFSNPILLALFTLPGKASILVLYFLLALGISWKYPKQALANWVGFWLVAALFGSVLSNRPYPHYLLQVVPPAALAIGLLLERITSWLSRGMLAIAITTVVGSTVLLGFSFYETKTYYQSAWLLLRQQIEPAEYRYRFNGMIKQNEELIPDIQAFVPSGESFFIWGTNPMLYAQSQRPPSTRFTVAFHIHDLKNYDETMGQIKDKQPKVIVVMKGEQAWDELNEYLELEYIPVIETQDMVLHHRRTQPVTWLLQ